MKSFSFIVPVYNTEEKRLTDCIESILRQESTDLEIIMVNDGSNDVTSHLCSSMAASDVRIKLINQQNMGPSTARNKGIDVANKDYIAFVDSDDTISNDFIKVLDSYLNGTEDIVVYGTNLAYPHKNIKQDLWYEELDKSSRKELSLAIMQHKGKYGGIIGLDATWGKAYSNKFIKHHNLQFNTILRRHEDSIFCLNAFIKANTIKIIPLTGYNYIFNSNSICQKYDKTVFKDTDLVIPEYQKFVDTFYPEDPEVINALNFKIADIIMNDCTTRYFISKDNPNSMRRNAQEFKEYLINNPKYREAFCNIHDVAFPFNFYSWSIRNNHENGMFYIYAIINKAIRALTIR